MVVWKSEDMCIDILVFSSQLIHMSIHPQTGPHFCSTFVYGSTDRNERLELFRQLHDISRTISSPWLVLGDFNTVANFNER